MSAYEYRTRFTDRTGLDVQNTSGCGYSIVGEHGEPYYLAAGDTYYGEQDGLYSPNGGVFKTTNGVNAIINPDGSISSFGGSTASQIAMDWGGDGMMVLPDPLYDHFGGWKDSNFLSRHPDWPAHSRPSCGSPPRGSMCGGD